MSQHWTQLGVTCCSRVFARTFFYSRRSNGSRTLHPALTAGYHWWFIARYQPRQKQNQLAASSCNCRQPGSFSYYLFTAYQSNDHTTWRAASSMAGHFCRYNNPAGGLLPLASCVGQISCSFIHPIQLLIKCSTSKGRVRWGHFDWCSPRPCF